MLCEKCNKNQATVRVVKIVNGNKEQSMLCEQCATNLSDIGLSSMSDSFDNFGFQKLLNSLIGYVNSKDTDSIEDVQCKNCGTTYKEFKENGILGCQLCYETFKGAINPVVKRVQVDLEHIGKIPKKFGRNIVEKRKMLKLKEELQRCILSEEYEKAAELRDEIKKISDLIDNKENRDE